MSYLVRVVRRDGSTMWLGGVTGWRVSLRREPGDAKAFASRREAREAIGRASSRIPESCQYEVIARRREDDSGRKRDAHEKRSGVVRAGGAADGSARRRRDRGKG